MKAKYHPDCSALEASSGKKPSYAWRSLQSSCDLVQEGLVWRVGNGKKIRIWKDRWINSPSTYMVTSPPRILNSDSTVDSLIDDNTKWWDQDLLNRLFSREDSMAIQALPVSATDKEDTLIWRGTANGVFSVRSAYHIQNDRDLAARAGGSSGESKKKIWSIIWQLDIKSVEKNFLWRACHDSLPTKANLCSRKIISDPMCPICEQVLESAYHILWNCPSACDVWSAGCPSFQKSSCEGSTFLQVVEEMYEKCDVGDFCLFVSIARRIWLRRNGLIHEGTFEHPDFLVKQAHQEMEVLRNLMDEERRKKEPPDDPPNSTWKAPPQGWYKANWDAGIDRKKGRVGLGVIIRDHTGAMWAAKSQTRHGFLDPTAAEAWAALMAVQLCIEMGITHVQFEGDAENVVKAVKADDSNDRGWGQITEDILCSLQSIPQWEMRYSRRDTNRATHVLANLAVSDDMEMVWLYRPPDCIRKLLHAESSALRIQ
jgi:ribonuclease HI